MRYQDYVDFQEHEYKPGKPICTGCNNFKIQCECAERKELITRKDS